MKYLKYYISTLTLILAICLVFSGRYYPTVFFLGFSIFIIIGDYFLPEDVKVNKYSYPFLLYLPIYINFPLLIILLTATVGVLGSNTSGWFFEFFESYTQIKLSLIQNTITTTDKVFLIILVSLFIGIMATVPGHELIHRKDSRLNLFIGNKSYSIMYVSDYTTFFNNFYFMLLFAF